MEAWDETWKAHHLPMWAKKKIRSNAIRDGKWRYCFSSADDFIPRDVFDHWGSILRGETRALVAQPYGHHKVSAELWAKEMECAIEVIAPGPWNEGTTCFIFTPMNLPKAASHS